jgi:ketosteroid isomerase-like protein
MNGNTALVRQAFLFFGEGKIGDALALFSEDAEWCEPGDPGAIPYAGTFRGHVGVAKFLQIISTSLHVKKFLPVLFIAEHDRVVVTGINEAEVIATGKSYTTDWVYVFTIAHDKICRVQVSMDTLAIARAFTKD